MNSLHIRGNKTPTSKVKVGRVQKSPLDSLSPKKRAAPRAPRLQDDAHVLESQLPVLADFRGLDILSAIDYLKQLQIELPSKTGREKRTELLNRRRAMPPLILAHQVASLFPNMPDLEKEINFLVMGGRIVQIPLQNGDVGYIRTEDLNAPSELLSTPLTQLSDAQFRQFSQSGFLLRRDGQLVLSAPNIGLYFSALNAARKWILGHLRKAMTLEKNLMARYVLWRDGGIFSFESLMHDLVGSSRIEVLLLPVGRVLKITKRGREER